MRLIIALLTACVMFWSIPAEARQKHHHRGTVHHKSIEKRPSEFFGIGGLVDRARQYNGLTASQIGLHRHTQWCAAFLRHLGIGGKVDDRAISFLRLPHVAPQTGVIAVFPHHVGIVTGFDGRYPIIISGNSYGRRVYEGRYPRIPIAYVSPTGTPAVYSQN